MNTTIISLGVALSAALGIVLVVALVSLLSGAFYFLFGRPKIGFLKSEHGETGFAFYLSWNSAREPAKFDRIKLRLFNPFGSPTQVIVSHDFEPSDSTFARDLNMGIGLKELLKAKGLNDALMEIEFISSKDGVTYYFDMKGREFVQKRQAAVQSANQFNLEHAPVKSKPLFQTVERSFIADPLPQSNKSLKLASNPMFAGEFAAAGGAAGGGEAKANFAVSKVWIEPGCIVCNACEDIYPAVFEVLTDTCIVRPDYPKDNGLLVQEAAEACPVEVIKFQSA